MSANSDAWEAAKLYDYVDGAIEYVELGDREFLDRFEAWVVLCGHGVVDDPDNEVEVYLPRAIFGRLVRLARKSLDRPAGERGEA